MLVDIFAWFIFVTMFEGVNAHVWADVVDDDIVVVGEEVSFVV